MKKVLALFIFCLSFQYVSAQTTDFQSNPQLVMEEIFRAANEGDYATLSQLCPPDNSNDGDTQKYICDIASGSESDKTEFLSYFKGAKLNGEIEYSDGGQTATVPFWFNHPGGKSRSNETMNMVKIDGKWYLSSF
ncbi:MAG: hypothetical protein ACI8ZM_001117 [Crocinitomix sp.]|jgi:hypothetical protein